MGFWRDIAPKYGKHLILLMLVFLQIIIGIGGGIVATGIYYAKSNIVFPGVEVSGIHLQRLTQAEARDVLRGKLSLPSAITLVWKEEHFEVLLDDTVSHYMLYQIIVLLPSRFPRQLPPLLLTGGP